MRWPFYWDWAFRLGIAVLVDLLNDTVQTVDDIKNATEAPVPAALGRQPQRRPSCRQPLYPLCRCRNVPATPGPICNFYTPATTARFGSSLQLQRRRQKFYQPQFGDDPRHRRQTRRHSGHGLAQTQTPQIHRHRRRRRWPAPAGHSGSQWRSGSSRHPAPFRHSRQAFFAPYTARPPNPPSCCYRSRRKVSPALARQFDCIIVDTPPIGLVSDALLLKPTAYGALYLIRQGVSKKGSLQLVDDLYVNKN